MTKTTILEEFKILFDTSMSSKMFIAAIIFIILLAIIALTTNEKNAKRSKRIYALVYIVIIISLVIMYHDYLGQMFDYMMNNFFIVFYFPNIAVYMAAILITNIIIWTSIFNMKTPKLLRIINVIAYGIIHYLLALVLNIISKNELDIFSQTSIYGNREAQAIIELSSTIFIVWIIFLIFYKVIRHFQLTDVAPVAQKVVIKKVRTLPEGINEIEAPLFVKAQPKKENLNVKKIDEAVVNQLIEEANFEKEILEQQLAETKERLFQAEEQLTVQQSQIKSTAIEQERFHQEKLKFEESYSKLYDTQQRMIKIEHEKLRQEQEKLQQEKNNLLQEKKALEKQRETPQPKVVDATATIMQNLDSMFTLEDYKALATLLKEKQRKKSFVSEKNEFQESEENKFNQIREVYKSAR